MSDLHDRPGRRTVMLGGAGVVAAGLTACGGSDSAQPSGTGTTSTLGSSTSSDAAVSVKAADVPVGGGVVVGDARIVVTQPTTGEFKAFSAVCPHQGCTVASVTKDVIQCPCHGSLFDATSGAPVGGPATVALPARQFTVKGGTIRVEPA